MSEFFNLGDAKRQLSRLVERAAAGEEIIITKNGIALAKLVAAAVREPRRPAHALGLDKISGDFDAPLPRVIRAAFAGRPK